MASFLLHTHFLSTTHMQARMHARTHSFLSRDLNMYIFYVIVCLSVLSFVFVYVCVLCERNPQVMHS